MHSQLHEGFDETLPKDHDAEWKLAFAASSRSAQATSEGAEALVEVASGG